MMEHAVYVSLYFKPCSGTLFVRVNAQVFWLITPPLYHFSSSLFISALPSTTPLSPLTALSIASLNQPCQVYKYNDEFGSEFVGGPLQRVAPLQRYSHDTATVRNKAVYISLHFSYVTTGEAAFNEYYQSNILKMSEVVRQPHHF